MTKSKDDTPGLLALLLLAALGLDDRRKHSFGGGYDSGGAEPQFVGDNSDDVAAPSITIAPVIDITKPPEPPTDLPPAISEPPLPPGPLPPGLPQPEDQPFVGPFVDPVTQRIPIPPSRGVPIAPPIGLPGAGSDDRQPTPVSVAPPLPIVDRERSLSRANRAILEGPGVESLPSLPPAPIVAPAFIQTPPTARPAHDPRVPVNPNPPILTEAGQVHDPLAGAFKVLSVGAAAAGAVVAAPAIAAAIPSGAPAIETAGGGGLVVARSGAIATGQRAADAIVTEFLTSPAAKIASLGGTLYAIGDRAANPPPPPPPNQPIPPAGFILSLIDRLPKQAPTAPSAPRPFQAPAVPPPPVRSIPSPAQVQALERRADRKTEQAQNYGR